MPFADSTEVVVSGCQLLVVCVSAVFAVVGYLQLILNHNIIVVLTCLRILILRSNYGTAIFLITLAGDQSLSGDNKFLAHHTLLPF